MMWIFVSLTLFVLVGFAVLNTETVQRRIAGEAAAFLSKEIGSTVLVGNASFALFNQVKLYEVRVDDQDGDTLLYVKELDVKFSPLQFFKKRFVFRHFRIKSLYACLRNDVEKGNNFDFIVQALQSKDTTRRRDIFYEFKSIQLVDCRIRYTSNRAAPKSGVFDVNNLDAGGLNAKLSVDIFDNDSLSLRLTSLCFTEKSGLEVRNIAAVVNAGKAGAEIEDFVLQLPRTNFQTHSLSFDYGSFEHFKYFADSVDFELSIKPSEVFVGDFAAFLPELGNVNQQFGISGTLTGSLSKLLCPTLKITYGNATQLVGYFSFDGLPDIGNTYFHAGISNLTCTRNDVENLVANITGSPFQLPPQLQSVERLQFYGETKGYLRDLSTEGSIKTNLGQINCNFSLQKQQGGNVYEYRAAMETNDFQLGRLLGNGEIDRITFNLNLHGTQTAKHPPDFDIEGLVGAVSYNDYVYSNITLNGHYSHYKFNGKVNLDDDNGKVQIDGLLDFSQALPYYDFTAKVQGLQPAKMNLVKSYPEMMFSFSINANARGNNLDNLAGNVVANDIHLRNGDRELVMKKLEVLSDISDSLSSIVISSDFANGIVEGKYTLSTIVASIQYVASQYIPALSNAKNNENDKRNVTDNNFDFDLKIKNSDSLTNFLGIGWQAGDIINVFGFYDDYTQKFRLRAMVPELENGKWFLSNINFTCENPADKMNLALDFNILNNRHVSTFDVYLRSQAKDNALDMQLQWTNNKDEGFYAGELSASTVFGRNEDDKLTSIIDILASNVVVSDTLWNVQPAAIKIEPQRIAVENLVLNSQTQNININGIASKSENDRVEAVLSNVNLDILKRFIVMDAIDLGGIVNGKATVSRVLDNPIFQISVFAKDFSFNQSRWGDVTLHSLWQGEQERLVIDGGVNDNGKHVAKLSGYIYPLRNIDLDIKISADNLKIDFLQPFLKNIMQNVSGYASAKNLRMLGSISKPVFEGNIAIKNATFGIDFLKTTYSFSDTIRMTRNAISFKDITLYDSEKNQAKASGNIHHELYKNFVFNINGNFNNMLGLNTQEKDSESFYGKVYGTGKLSISGNSREIVFDIGVKTERHSHLSIPFSAYLKANENDFITFVRPSQTPTGNQVQRRTLRRTQESASANIKMNLQIDATPDCEVRLIVDPVAGDMIKAAGSGSIRFTYDSQNDMKMYGTYIISAGSYHFSLQDVIQKIFTIKEGSTIAWNGSPYAADININAQHSVTASLRDLLDAESNPTIMSGNTTVKVNCLLKLTGDLMTPNIKFDIEFPGSTPELVQTVKNVISSDDMMSRQMLYLLAMGRFYRPDYLNNSSSSNNSGLSLVSSTLSSQLNALLSQLSDNFTMGVNYRQSAEGEDASQEFETLIGAKMFDDRLIIDGTVGYRNDANMGSNITGDFDMEYKLNRSGKFRWKAYSHSNNKYYLRNTSTQGTGIIYREEFDTFGGLARGYWNKILMLLPQCLVMIPLFYSSRVLYQM